MSLLKTETANNAAFESDDDTATPQTTAQAAPQTAVATQAAPQTAVAVRNVTPDPVGSFKDAMRVEYNTLEAIKVHNGNFVSRETNKALGDEIEFELLSWQDSYVVSANDDKAPKETLRYSDDGKMCSDGTSVQEHLDTLRQDWPKAALKNRTVVVAALKKTSKPVGMEETLVQFDLSPASRVYWNRYMANVAYMTKVGKFKGDPALIKGNAEIASSGTNDFTVAKFSSAN